jgi:hypothetical protein
MPLYLFQSPKTEEVKEVFFGMNDTKEYSEDGIPWLRIYTVPQGVVKETLDHNNAKQFAHYTKHKKGNVGNIMDLANQMSEKRAKESKDGRDKLKDAAMDKWSKERGGKKHTEDDRGR